MKRLAALIGAIVLLAVLAAPVSAGGRTYSLTLITPGPYAYLEDVTASWTIESANVRFLEQCSQGGVVVDREVGTFIQGIYSGTVTVKVGNHPILNSPWNRSIAAQCSYQLFRPTGQKTVEAEVAFTVGP